MQISAIPVYGPGRGAVQEAGLPASFLAYSYDDVVREGREIDFGRLATADVDAGRIFARGRRVKARLVLAGRQLHLELTGDGFAGCGIAQFARVGKINR